MRINIIPVSLLSDRHLQAEFREIIMSIHYYKRSVNSRKGIDDSKISKYYTLNGGHAMMWYNKFKFVENRYNELLVEMKTRNFKTSSIEDKFQKDFNEYIPVFRKNDYIPTKDEFYINIERILYRIYTKIYKDNKPDFYKYNKKKMKFIDWCILYTEKLDLNQEKMFYMIQRIEKDNPNV